MLISISSLAIADEAGEEQDQEDETPEQEDADLDEEISVMNIPLGAEIRLLQLQKALLKNILKGEMAIEVLKGLEFDPDNITILEEILDKMKDLSEGLDELLEDMTDLSHNESAQIFVENKSLAKNLTRQFREKIREMLSDVELSDLREQIKEMINESLQNLGEYIKNRIRQFNRNQLYKLYDLIKDTDNSFIEQYLNGDITLGFLKLQICKIINNMSKERRYGIFSEIKEENLKRKINADAFLDEIHNKGKGRRKWG